MTAMRSSPGTGGPRWPDHRAPWCRIPKCATWQRRANRSRWRKCRDVYLPLAQLLALIAQTTRDAQRRIDDYLGEERVTAPFIIGIAGGVAVGKSTTARVLQVLLRRTGTTDLLTTDGFLWPNDTLEARGMLDRKGFPESYDQRRLVETLASHPRRRARKCRPPSTRTSPMTSSRASSRSSGSRPSSSSKASTSCKRAQGGPPPPVACPTPSTSRSTSTRPKLTLHAGSASDCSPCARAANEPGSFFHGLASLSEGEFTALAEHVWNQVNLVNLRQNVAPTRGRADLIVEKGSDHLVDRILLRRP